jgi:hypothetical protein
MGGEIGPRGHFGALAWAWRFLVQTKEERANATGHKHNDERGRDHYAAAA